MGDAAEVNGGDTPAGSGARNIRAASGLTETRDARLTAMAIEKGWISSSRWGTQTPRKRLVEDIEERGDATFLEDALLTAGKLIDSGKNRTMGIGVRLIVAMERQNQVDQHAAIRANTDPQTQGLAPAAPDQIAAAMDASVPSAAAG